MSHCELLINNTHIIDGSGESMYPGYVAVDSGMIVGVGNISHWQADQVIDAAGLCLAPGFIDTHTHDDLAVLNSPDMTAKISQGVTTVIAGNCGISMAPLCPDTPLPAPFPLLGPDREYVYPSVRAYRDAFEHTTPSTNLALLTGHSSIRAQVLGENLGREAENSEIEHMVQILRRALDQGSIGLSSGLDYPPANQASSEEMIKLAGVLRDFPGTVYTTHMRDEGDHVIESVRESLTTAASASVPVIISHHKCAGPSNYGKSRATLELIEQARRHQAVGLDAYPYTASSTSLIPRFIREAEEILIAYSEPHPECARRSLFDVAREWNMDPEQAAQKLYPAGAIYFQMDEADLERILKYPATMIGSDGLPGMPNPHPRLWGTFPRVLGRYVRERQLLTLPDAIHKMTGLPAQTFSLKRRGLIKAGFHADLVLFDPTSIIDTATYEQPEQVSRGISRVWVNGELTWSDNHHTGNGAGQFLSH